MAPNWLRIVGSACLERKIRANDSKLLGPFAACTAVPTTHLGCACVTHRLTSTRTGAGSSLMRMSNPRALLVRIGGAPGSRIASVADGGQSNMDPIEPCNDGARFGQAWTPIFSWRADSCRS